MGRATFYLAMFVGLSVLGDRARADHEADLLNKFQKQNRSTADQLRLEASQALTQGKVEPLHQLLEKLQTDAALPNTERSMLVRKLQDRLRQLTGSGVQQPTAGSTSLTAADSQKPTSGSPQQGSASGNSKLQLGPWVRVTTNAGTVLVPDGGVAVQSSVSSALEARNEAGVPILGKVPYLGRGFRNVGTGSSISTVQRSVSVRIISLIEEDAKLLGK